MGLCDFGGKLAECNEYNWNITKFIEKSNGLNFDMYCFLLQYNTYSKLVRTARGAKGKVGITGGGFTALCAFWSLKMSKRTPRAKSQK